jgi:HNH endonuclease
VEHDLSPKLCECGCGQPAPIATYTSKHWGWTKGQPKRFKRGHASPCTKPSIWSDDLWEKRDLGYSTMCWFWLGVKDRNGYGRFGSQSTQGSALAHRISYERAHGPIAEGLDLDHLCRNPSCVNPGHLEPVTHRENLRRGAGAKLSYEKAERVRQLRAQGLTHRVIAEQFGVSTRTISDTLAGKRWD